MSSPIADDEDVSRLVSDMTIVMYDHGGVGLAAVQIGVTKRVILADISGMTQAPVVMINPKIVYRSLSTDLAPEGCLSLPGVEARVERSKDIVVEYYDQERNHRVRACEGLLARVVQHEVDHLDGAFFIDRLSPMKFRRILDRYNQTCRRQKPGR